MRAESFAFGSGITGFIFAECRHFSDGSSDDGLVIHSTPLPEVDGCSQPARSVYVKPAITAWLEGQFQFWFVHLCVGCAAPRKPNKAVEATAIKSSVEVGVLRAVPHLSGRPTAMRALVGKVACDTTPPPRSPVCLLNVSAATAHGLVFVT